LEECISGETLPSAELDLDVSAFGRVCCAMLDIPVHHSLKESLHVLFTL
jgi:intraflagellar transport protein 46